MKYIPVDMLKLAVIAGCIKSVDDILNLAVDSYDVYRQVQHEFLLEDAHNFVRDYIANEQDRDPDEIDDEEIEGYDYEYLIKQYEDKQDCNVAFNDTWESVVSDYMEGLEEDKDQYVHPVHGKIVGSFQEGYWDGVIYEDGYRERTYYQGD